MAMRKLKARTTSGEVWIRVASYKRKYYISRPEHGLAGRTDDEAQLEIEATIEAVSPPHKKHLGATLELSLLSAQDYSSERSTVSPFFGSVTLSGSQRSALAYLPPKPFWELPSVIGSGATWISLGWSSMHRGYADLTSVFVGDEGDLEQFGAGYERLCNADDGAGA